MNDLNARFTDVFKNALLAELAKAGIHKGEAGWSIGGGGIVAPMILNGELAGFGPTWMFTLSLRSLLLGQNPIAGSLPIHDVLPSEAEIKNVAKRLVTDVEAARQLQFKGES